MRRSLGYQETLKRGFVVVRQNGKLVLSADQARRSPRLELEFHDGKVQVRPEGSHAKEGREPSGGQQKSLF